LGTDSKPPEGGLTVSKKYTNLFVYVRT